MLDKILKNKHLNTLDKTKPIVIALSGGVDSMALFYLLKNAGYTLVIAHVNHHKREQSTTEENYIKKLAKDNNFKVEVFDYYHEKNNFQAEAHIKRYDFFYNVAKKYNCSCLVTAHHYIDNLETILMNIIRGSNIYGYAGIKDFTYYNDLPIIRPLINVDKNELYKYALDNSITYFEDSSNESDQYLRNRIRHHVIPLLQQENPSLNTSVANYSTQLHEAFAYIRDNSVKYLEEYGNKIDVNSFNNLALIQKKDIINYICDSNGILSNDNKINDILDLIENPRPNLTYDLNGDFQFIKAYNSCYIKKITQKEEINYQINFGDEITISSYGSFSLSNENESADVFLKISLNEPLPLTIRKRCDGDKLIIGNGHKKLKDFLIDKKVPKERRDDLLIITNAINEIIWVIGYYKKKCDEEKSLILSFKEKIYDRKI